MSSGKRYALFLVAMVVWFLFFSFVLQPLFFPPAEITPPAETEEKDTPPVEKTTEKKTEPIETTRTEPEDTTTDVEEPDESVVTPPETVNGEEFSFNLYDREFALNKNESEPGRKLVYEYFSPAEKIKISKIYTINPAPADGAETTGDTKEKDPFIINLTIRFENQGEAEFKQPGYLLSAGTVSMLSPGSTNSDIYFTIQDIATKSSSARSAKYTKISGVNDFKYAAVTNKYFASIIEPADEETRKKVTKVVMRGFLPSENPEDFADGILEDLGDHLENGYLYGMFRNRGASVTNFVLPTNSIIKGRYQDGRIQHDMNTSYHLVETRDRERPFAISSPEVKENEEKIKDPDIRYSLAIGMGRITIQPGEKLEQSFRLYIGPKEYRRLKQLGYENAVGFNRWLRPINIAFIRILHWFYGIVPNYGIAILLLTLLLKIVLFPLDQKSYRSMKEMQKIQPLIAELKQKYKDDPKKVQLRQMELFREHKVNPLGGCLPLLLQFPVLIAMFSTLRVIFELRGAPFMWWINDLSQPDRLITFEHGFWMFKSINILPLFMIVAFYFQQKMSATMPKDPNDPQYKQQQMMNRLFPIVFGLIFYNMQSGLTLYFTFSTVLRIIQQLWVIKQPDSATTPAVKTESTKRT